MTVQVAITAALLMNARRRSAPFPLPLGFREDGALLFRMVSKPDRNVAYISLPRGK
jgi:hypothetical protein